MIQNKTKREKAWKTRLPSKNLAVHAELPTILSQLLSASTLPLDVTYDLMGVSTCFVIFLFSQNSWLRNLSHYHLPLFPTSNIVNEYTPFFWINLPQLLPLCFSSNQHPPNIFLLATSPLLPFHIGYFYCSYQRLTGTDINISTTRRSCLDMPRIEMYWKIQLICNCCSCHFFSYK